MNENLTELLLLNCITGFSPCPFLWALSSLALIQFFSFLLHLSPYDPYTSLSSLHISSGLLVSSLSCAQPLPSLLKGTAEITVESSDGMRGFKEGIHEKDAYKLKNSVIRMILLFHAGAIYSNTPRCSLSSFFLSHSNPLLHLFLKTGLLLELWGWGNGKEMGNRNTLSFWQKHFVLCDFFPSWLFLCVITKNHLLPEETCIIPSSDLIYARVLLEL